MASAAAFTLQQTMSAHSAPSKLKISRARQNIFNALSNSCHVCVEPVLSSLADTKVELLFFACLLERRNNRMTYNAAMCATLHAPSKIKAMLLLTIALKFNYCISTNAHTLPSEYIML